MQGAIAGSKHGSTNPKKLQFYSNRLLILTVLSFAIANLRPREHRYLVARQTKDGRSWRRKRHTELP